MERSRENGTCDNVQAAEIFGTIRRRDIVDAALLGPIHGAVNILWLDQLEHNAEAVE